MTTTATTTATNDATSTSTIVTTTEDRIKWLLETAGDSIIQRKKDSSLQEGKSKAINIPLVLLPAGNNNSTEPQQIQEFIYFPMSTPATTETADEQQQKQQQQQQQRFDIEL